MVGVEPCKNLAEITNSHNIKTYDNFWDLNLSKKIHKNLTSSNDNLRILKYQFYIDKKSLS